VAAKTDAIIRLPLLDFGLHDLLCQVEVIPTDNGILDEPTTALGLLLLDFVAV
jgi:hypothetical protein